MTPVLKHKNYAKRPLVLKYVPIILKQIENKKLADIDQAIAIIKKRGFIGTGYKDKCGIIAALKEIKNG